MAGASGDGTRELYQTPTWAVALICAVMIIISLLMEKGLHHIGEWFKKKNKTALFEALEKVKNELMILGFISLLLVFFQNYIAEICIPESVGNTMLPCRRGSQNKGKSNRRLLWAEIMDSGSIRRILAGDSSTVTCKNGKVPLMSTKSLHELHLFIFFLAVVHVVYSASVMALGRLKIRSWKEWEKETMSINYEFSTDPSRFRFTHETSFVRQHASFWSRTFVLLYIVSFFRQFIRSVRKTDYLTLRHGFINAHLNPGMKFNFQKYIKRSLEDDFKVVVGISPILWACGVIILLLNVYEFQELFWVTLLPLFLILAVGTKLQAIIASMALEIQQRHAVIQGMPLVKLSDHHFWFGKPRLVLFLIHFTLFVNAFQLTYFFWIWYKFGLDSCFHENFGYVIARVCIGFAVHLLCSYITLPLYALVSQMGSHIKMSIFDDQTSKALKKWRDAARKRHKKGSSHSPSVTPSPSPGQSPRTSPRASPASRHLYNYRTMGNARDGMKRSHSDNDISDAEIEMPIGRSELSQQNTPHEVRLDIEEERERRDDDDFSFVKLGSRKGQSN
ncbi:MLO-like protein [Rhynchospora pubera]|uniref:MLO-like protein n=1 Tax=Rhynchospora pubera TaxID=906938 RepID=A0AAV8EE04_9POAL|nr:MLO-like protein [Rhynchospora pubera]